MLGLYIRTRFVDIFYVQSFLSTGQLGREFLNDSHNPYIRSVVARM